jgi:hypothetical protein
VANSNEKNICELNISEHMDILKQRENNRCMEYQC